MYGGKDMEKDYIKNDENSFLFDKNIIKDNDEFVLLQNFYRQSLEKIIKKVINIDNYNNKIDDLSCDIPIIDDSEFNIYRRNSTLNSDYFYLRNNIHIERLSKEDLKFLKHNLIHNIDLNPEFFSKTISILFEKGDYTNYLYNSKDYMVKSKSLVFEFAFDARKINNINELAKIENGFEIISNEFSDEITKKLGVLCSSYIYESLPIFYKTDNFKTKA